MWNVFAGLAIKDFHTDIGSLMDSIALMLIRLESTVSLDGWVPPFSAIQNEQGKKKTYRKTIPESILLVVDETDRWWPTVKNVRDLGIHKEHLRIVYPGLSEDDGLLFNVYRGGFTPVISEPLVMYPNGNNVVDFSLYSGFILAEVLMFLEDLAAPIADSFGVQNLTPSLRQDDFSRLASAWNRLAQPKS